METNFTLKQKLIYMMAEKLIGKYGLQELTDGTISTIKYIANKLVEGIPEEKPGTEVKYPPFEREMRMKTIRYLEHRGIYKPEQLIEYDFKGKSLSGFAANIELLQYAMNHNIKLKNFHYK